MFLNEYVSSYIGVLTLYCKEIYHICKLKYIKFMSVNKVYESYPRKQRTDKRTNNRNVCFNLDSSYDNIVVCSAAHVASTGLSGTRYPRYQNGLLNDRKKNKNHLQKKKKKKKRDERQRIVDNFCNLVGAGADYVGYEPMDDLNYGASDTQCTQTYP